MDSNLSVLEKMNKIFAKCSFEYNNCIVSKEKLLLQYKRFILDSINSDSKYNLVFHTGSDCFDIFGIILVSMLCICCNEIEPEDILNRIKEEEMLVIYKNCKYRYYGVIDDNCNIEYKKNTIVLIKEDKYEKIYVSKKNINQIIPYEGSSNSTSSCGIKKKSNIREDFFIKVLEMNKQSIPSIIESAFVILTQRIYAEELFKNIFVLFDDDKNKISLNELVFASYYSEN